MCYVHGHARAVGWVVSHVRRPHRPEEGQLPLLLAGPCEAVVAVPSPRLSPEARRVVPSEAPADRG